MIADDDDNDIVKWEKQSGAFCLEKVNSSPPPPSVSLESFSTTTVVTPLGSSSKLGGIKNTIAYGKKA
ncbi:unnamed protein product [Onchocerca flexuosa]|uniref:Ovule protein n=1 Tax=Onchocerca flexuosa TaxID=387005 RepID=A0A183HBB6_9BILA|nr:unnamed protein product [Onchocerca flexuosa]